jgi:hypothetical protein
MNEKGRTWWTGKMRLHIQEIVQGVGFARSFSPRQRPLAGWVVTHLPVASKSMGRLKP